MPETQTILKASELRIGNLIQVGHGPRRYLGTILTITQHHFDISYLDVSGFAPPIPEDKIHGYAQIKHEVAQPIPLTPEILEKAGFDGSHRGWTKDIGNPYHATWLQWYEEDKEVFVSMQDDHYYIPNATAQYLHQLQNLYFALTGTELQIEL